MRITSLLLIGALCACPAMAQEPPKPAAQDASEIAKKLANPIGALISVPFQSNMDVGIGEEDSSRNTMNFQPIVPFALNEKYSLITRYILPIIAQHDVSAAGTNETGLADTLVSGWISNRQVKNGVVWGVGGAFLVPTATDGALVNQVWSVAGDEARKAVNQMYLQPFVTYNWRSGTGLTMNTELTQNWEASTTTAFVNIMAGGLLKFGGQLAQIQIGPRIQVAAPEEGKAAFGVRTALILVLPK